MKIYLVGGAVRDKLLGLDAAERDWVVVGSTPEEMQRLGYRPVGKDFPVFLHPDTHEEYALARTERKKGHGYKGFTIHASPEVTLEEDLRRRDLTINAIAEDASGNLIDPFHGAADLQSGTLRHVSGAFVEDPVRILRVARFAARLAKWGFKVAHSTHALMKKMVENGEIDYLVPERVWSETVKALREETPHRFFEVLHRCGALSRLFPEIDALHESGKAQAHRNDETSDITAIQALQRAAAVTDNTRIRFAALVHEVDSIESLCDRLRIPNDFRNLARLVIRFHEQYPDIQAMDASGVLDMLQAMDAFRRPQRLDEFIEVCEIVHSAGGKAVNWSRTDYLRQARDAAAAVSGNSLSDSEISGPEIGRRMREERIAAIKRSGQV
jgi:tRNA nucleotidyltransferase (CCA-adding enzyme)